jgi:hypothetical protein
VKLSVISISILLIVSFSVITTFAETKDKNSQPAEKAGQRTRLKKRLRQRATDIKSIADANAVAEPNAAKRKSGEPDKTLERINRQGQKEIREWGRGTDENRMDLAKAVQKQIIAELNYLRRLATKEGAVKTTQAINTLLASRRERFEKITEEAGKTREKMRRRSERGERKGRQTRSIRSRDRSRDLEDRSSRRKRPRRRDRKAQEDNEEY